MPEPPLVLAGLVSLVAAALWGSLGMRLLRRPSTPHTAPARRAFALAWLGAATYVGLTVIVNATALAGLLTPQGALVAAWAAAFSGLVAFAGLMAHLAYLLTGRPGAVRVVLVIYALQLVALVAVILALGPVAGEATAWRARFVFAHAPAGANEAISASIIVPALVACLAYLSVLHAARDATSRWRIALVAGPTALWLLTALAVRLLPVPESAMGAGRVMAALAAVATYAAYSPPDFARRRWGIIPLDGDPPPPEGALERSRAREERLRQRAHDLL